MTKGVPTLADLAGYCVEVDQACVPAIIDLPMLLQRAVDEAARLLGVDAAVIYLLDRDSGRACWSYDAGIPDEWVRAAVRETELEPGQGLVGLTLLRREVVTTEDYGADARVWSDDRARQQETATLLGIRSAISAPLVGAREALGVLCVFTRQTRAFSDAEVALVRALADHAALAIENSRLNEELLASEARYRALLERTPDAVWAADSDGTFTFVSDAAETLVGWTPEELLGHNWDFVNHESTIDEVHRRLAWSMANPTESQIFRCNLRHRDGHPVPVEINATGIAREGHVDGAIGSVRDMTERQKLEGELQAQASELAASQERVMLAQELHDSVTQALFSMTLTIGSAEILLGRGDAAGTAQKLGELRDLGHDALAEMRALIFELQPESLVRQGLVAALRRHVEAVRGRTGIPVRLEADLAGRLPRQVEECLYRIAQEALHNVVKHASASLAVVRVEPIASGVRLVIEDDGIGFDPAAVHGEHLGLVGMGVRAGRLGAQVTIDSRPGEGTRIAVTVPLEEPPGGMT
jgi:PAS domain S-box-containing protein